MIQKYRGLLLALCVLCSGYATAKLTGPQKTKAIKDVRALIADYKESKARGEGDTATKKINSLIAQIKEVSIPDANQLAQEFASKKLDITETARSKACLIGAKKTAQCTEAETDLADARLQLFNAQEANYYAELEKVQLKKDLAQQKAIMDAWIEVLKSKAHDILILQEQLAEERASGTATQEQLDKKAAELTHFQDAYGHALEDLRAKDAKAAQKVEAEEEEARIKGAGPAAPSAAAQTGKLPVVPAAPTAAAPITLTPAETKKAEEAKKTVGEEVPPVPSEEPPAIPSGIPPFPLVEPPAIPTAAPVEPGAGAGEEAQSPLIRKLGLYNRLLNNLINNATGLPGHGWTEALNKSPQTKLREDALALSQESNSLDITNQAAVVKFMGKVKTYLYKVSEAAAKAGDWQNVDTILKQAKIDDLM